MDQIKSLALLVALFGSTELFATTVSVYNPAPFVRQGAIVEIPGEKILKSFGPDFIVYDTDGNSLIHQLTHDGKILVESNLPAQSTVIFSIEQGTPSVADTICIGQIRNDLQDDFTWENDRSGYRLYGPSYRKGGGNVAGYDIWTKSVDYPVLAQRYVDHCQHGVSYHKDYGNGMDCYTVGKTLGAGMNALAPEGEIAYPCAYESCEILDNGPLRTTAKITCYPEKIGTDREVVEERIISLDKGSWLNKTSVTYKGLSEKLPLVTGIVVHKQNQHGQVIDPQKRYVAYADLTDNPDNGNGVIYIGIVNAQAPESSTYEKYDEPLGDAVGQILNKTEIAPGEIYTYYWGSGWSKGGVRGVDDWTAKLARFHEELKYPLVVKF
ncbi:MAG: DUF4861 domain-containing protein [Bacteroides sp.]|nr:DUF4861 domain-containing protein [Bacteroides sp.]